MLRIALVNECEQKELTHAAGPLEFGRGPERDVSRCIVVDPYVSRDHLCLEEVTEGRVRLTNLSHTAPILIGDDQALEMGRRCERPLPLRLQFGKTVVTVEAEGPAAAFQRKTTATMPAHTAPPPPPPPQALPQLGSIPSVQTLSHWLDTVIAIQQAAIGSGEFYQRTARGLVDLVGLDRGLVLLREGDDWKVVAMEAANDQAGHNFSRSVLDDVLRRKNTFFQHLDSADSLRASLANVEAVVAAPVLDKQGEVVGAVYGSRARGAGQKTVMIQPLEAQLVQVLAAAVGVGLARQNQEAEATRAQVQFEQFFSAKLARELARDTRMLEGREREITILFSDVRRFSLLSEQLGPRDIFRLMQDVMELQSATVREFDGVVVDYYGDGLLAMWNAPTDQPRHAVAACQAALQIIERLPDVQQRWAGALAEPLRLGIGINTGAALVGNTGSQVKVKYGPIGAAVNVASRVERAVKHFGVSALITGSTCDQLDGTFATRRLGAVRLAGVASAVQLFELHAANDVSQWKQRRDAFERALSQFERGNWAEACQQLYLLLGAEEGRYDVPSLHLLARAVECLKSPPQSFDAVIDLSRS